MSIFYLNLDDSNNPGHNHEVHVSSCPFFPSPSHRTCLGAFSSAKDAVQAAKNLGYADADGCAVCCPEAHHG